MSLETVLRTVVQLKGLSRWQVVGPLNSNGLTTRPLIPGSILGLRETTGPGVGLA